MENWYYLVAIFGGFLAGCINTLAGSGSAITLTVLTELLGLPPNVANGSNRIGVLAQGIGGTYSFYKNGKLNLKRDFPYIVPTFIGAMIGFYIAVNIDNATFKSAFRYFMILMLLIVLIKPKRWLREATLKQKPNYWLIIPCFVAIGIYGGFIQMGMGVFYLATMVLGAKYNIMDGNAVKVFVTASYTIIGIMIFQYKGLIDWKMGSIVAIGQFVGGILTAHYAPKFKSADKIAYYMLLTAIVFSIVILFR